MIRKPLEKVAILFFVPLVLFFLQACSGKQHHDKLERSISRSAHQYLGVPYVSGGRSPSKGFDCSGLVWYIFNQHGIELPPTSRQQARIGAKVKRGELRPGDLLFFGSGTRVSHVGVYVGNGVMIHAPGRGKKVTKAELDKKYYKDHFVVAKRVI